MKPPRFSPFARAFIAFGGIVTLTLGTSQAANIFWDTNGNTAGSSDTTDKIWGVDAVWTTDTTGSVATSAYVAGSDVYFSAGAVALGSSTVTVSGTQLANSINFQEGNYTLMGTSSPALTIGAGGLTMSGALVGNILFDATLGDIILSGSQTWSNGTTSAAPRTLTVDAGILGSATTGNTFTLTLGGGSATAGLSTLSGVIGNGANGGELALTKGGATSFTLSGNSANTYTGLTTVSGGILTLSKTAGVNAIAGEVSVTGGTLTWGNSNQINDTSNLVMTGGTVDFARKDETIASATLSGGAALVTGATGTAAHAVTITGALATSGTSKVTVNSGSKLVANSITLSGTNSGLNVAGGNILIQSDSATAVTTLEVGSGGLTMSGQTIQFNQTTSPNLGSKLILGGDFTATGTSNNSIGYGASVQTFNSTIDIGSANRLFTIGGGTTTISVAIAGTGSITKAGAGTLTLSRANTFTGSVTANAGTLILSAGNAYTGTTSIASGAIINVQNATGLGTTAGGTTAAAGGTLQLQGGITVTGESLSIQGSTTAGLVNVSGTNVWTGSVLADSTNNVTSLISSTSGSLTLSGGVSISSGTTGGGLELGGVSGATGTISGIISGTGSQQNLIRSGAGTWTLSGTAANTYTGLTTVSGGTLSLSKTDGVNAIAGNILVTGGILSMVNGNQIANTSTITVTGGSVTFLGKNETIAGLNISGGTFETGNNAALSTVAITGDIVASGTGRVTFNSGVAISVNGISLSGTNDSNGNVLIGGNATTVSTIVNIGSGGITMTGQTFRTNAGTTTGVKGSLINLGGDITATGDNLFNINGSPVTGALRDMDIGSGTRNFNINSGTTTVSLRLIGSGALTKTGAGTLVINAGVPNTYTGLTTITGGILNIQHASSLGTSAAGTVVNAGGSLQLQGNLAVVGETLTLNGSTTAGLVNVSGANSWSGAVTANTNGASNIRISTTAGSLTLSGAVGFTNSAASLGLELGGNAGNGTISGNLTGSGTAQNLIKSGDGTWTLSGTNAWTGTTTINGGLLSFTNLASFYGGDTSKLTTTYLQVASGGGLGLNLNAFSATDVSTLLAGNVLSAGSRLGLDTTAAATTLSIAITDANGGANSIGFTRYGATAGNVLTLGGATSNTYTGTTIIAGGTLALAKTGGATAIGTDTFVTGGNLTWSGSNQVANAANITVSSGTLNLNGQSETINDLTMSGGSMSIGTGTLTANAVNFSGGANRFTVSSGGTFNATSLTFTGAAAPFATTNGGNLLIGSNSTTVVSKLVIGSGGLSMSGQNIQFNQVTTTNALGGQIVLNGNFTGSGTNQIAFGGTAGTLVGNVSLGGATRTFNITADTTTIGVRVTSGGVTKTGGGILSLSAANDYAGGTTISGGSLLATNTTGSATGTGAVSVGSTALLGGTGIVSGAVTVQSGGSLAGTLTVQGNTSIQNGGFHSVAGTSISSQSFGANLSYAAGSTFSWDLGSETTAGAGTNFDSVTVGGQLSASNATFQINVTGLNLASTFWTTDQTWQVFTAGSTVGNFSNFVLYDAANLTNPVTYTNYGSFQFSSGTGTLRWAVPEPSNALAGLLIAAGLLRRNRSRRA